ncbi:MAG: hypothetical protein Q9160_002382 [Pyrenula sp. 1 TL-2023]
MDSSGAGFDLSKLTPTDQRELQVFVQNEAQKTSIQQTVHSLTDMCWKKCSGGRIAAGKLDSKEETCTQNCVGRFIDSQLAVVQHLEKLRQQQ